MAVISRANGMPRVEREYQHGRDQRRPELERSRGRSDELDHEQTDEQDGAARVSKQVEQAEDLGEYVAGK